MASCGNISPFNNSSQTFTKQSYFVWLIPRLKSKEPPQTFVPKSWYLGIQNGLIPRVFWNLNQSIEQKIKNLQLKKCRYITNIKITFLDTSQYFHSKQLTYSFEKIFSLKLGQVVTKSEKLNKSIKLDLPSCPLNLLIFRKRYTRHRCPSM